MRYNPSVTTDNLAKTQTIIQNLEKIVIDLHDYARNLSAQNDDYISKSLELRIAADSISELISALKANLRSQSS